ncbi:MAG: hypothetical protein QM813_27440 [Verrucomicrobiota bacterium]
MNHIRKDRSSILDDLSLRARVVIGTVSVECFCRHESLWTHNTAEYCEWLLDFTKGILLADVFDEWMHRQPLLAYFGLGDPLDGSDLPQWLFGDKKRRVISDVQ